MSWPNWESLSPEFAATEYHGGRVEPDWPAFRVRLQGSRIDYEINRKDTHLYILAAYTESAERNRGQQRILYKWLYDNYPHLTIVHGELSEDGEKYLKRYQRSNDANIR